MSVNTSIHWADSTCNPVMGCDGCELCNRTRRSCYSAVQHDMYGGVRLGYSPTFEQVTLWPGRMAAAARLPSLTGLRRHTKPWLDGMPRLIFVSDMGDALSASVPFWFLRVEIIDNVISLAGRRHVWLWLTKRPARMAEFAAWLDAQGTHWPNNLWAGTSITTAVTTSRIDELLRVENANTLKFVSVEPQIEPLDLRPWLSRLDWIIQGGESGPQARRFDVGWAEDMQRHCHETGTAYFLKQLGAYAFRGDERIRLRDGHGADWTEWPQRVAKTRGMPACLGPRAQGLSSQTLNASSDQQAGRCASSEGDSNA